MLTSDKVIVMLKYVIINFIVYSVHDLLRCLLYYTHMCTVHDLLQCLLYYTHMCTVHDLLQCLLYCKGTNNKTEISNLF
jgi:hypothetical protein